MSEPISLGEYPLFSGLCGAYLHQDWDLEDPDPYTAVDRFIEDMSTSAVQPLLDEIDRLRAQLRQRSEDQALDLLLDFHCYYYPAGVGLTVDAWLVNLSKRAAARKSA